ncbi:TPA: glycerol dehydrogenase, partial [Escherichia coli]
MDKIIISPAKYIQGNGSLDNIATYAASLGTEPLIIADEFVTGLVGDRVSQSFA